MLFLGTTCVTNFTDSFGIKHVCNTNHRFLLKFAIFESWNLWWGRWKQVPGWLLAPFFFLWYFGRWWNSQIALSIRCIFICKQDKDLLKIALFQLNWRFSFLTLNVTAINGCHTITTFFDVVETLFRWIVMKGIVWAYYEILVFVHLRENTVLSQKEIWLKNGLITFRHSIMW